MCLPITQANIKSYARSTGRVILARPPPVANRSIGIPHLFQNTIGIEDTEKQQHLLTKTILTQITVVPVPVLEKAALLGVYQLWTVSWGGFELLQTHSRVILQDPPALFRDTLYGSVSHHFSCSGINKQTNESQCIKER